MPITGESFNMFCRMRPLGISAGRISVIKTKRPNRTET